MQQLLQCDRIMSVEKILFAVDIEKAGAENIKHPIVAIGYVIGTENALLERGIIKLQVKWPTITDGKVADYGDFEPRCWDEFWGNSKKMPPELIEEFKKDALTQTDGIKKFAALVDSLEEKYGDEKKYKVRFLSDNPSYDIAALDVAMEQVCDRNPMRYDSTGKYRSLSDPWDMLDILPAEYKKQMLANIDKQLGSIVLHDHNPTNDAEVIYRQYLAALAAMKLLMTQIGV